MFLSGLFLLALPMIGVPIALHLYRGRQVDVVDWGAMHFLEDAVSDGRRWEKFEELLLLLLRVAAVAALVLSLAQPMVHGSWIGQYDRRGVVLVIDDSLSTAVESEGESVFALIKKEAIAAVDRLGGEDQVQLLAAAGGGRWLTPEPIAATAAGRRELTTRIGSLKPTEGAADLLACARSAAALTPVDDAAEMLVLVFTDGQANAFGAGGDDRVGAWTAWSEASSGQTPPVAARIVDCGLGASAPGNLAVGGLQASRTAIRSGDEVTLRCEVACFGGGPVTGAVEWRVEDRVVSRSKLGSLVPGETRETVATIRPTGRGVQRVRCVLTAEDELATDQSAELLIEVAERIPVLIVERPRDSAGDDDDRAKLAASEHLAAALGFFEGEPQSWRSVFEPQIVAPNDFVDADLRDCQAVVVTSVDGLGRRGVERLEAFVQAGGGLWVTLDRGTREDGFNPDWHDDGEGLCPLPLEEPPGVAPDPGAEELLDDSAFEASPVGTITIHPPEGDHPATAQLANTTQLDIDQVTVRAPRAFRLREDDDAPEVSVLLRSSGGAPLAIERYFGRGRVIVQAFPLDLSGSTLPLRKAFVVMVHDWLDYLTAPSQDRRNLTPGAPIVAAMPGADGRERSANGVAARLVGPTGEQTELAPRGSPTSPVFRTTRTGLPGAYRVQFRRGEETLDEQRYQVPRSLAESDLAALSEPERAAISRLAGVELVSTGGDHNVAKRVARADDGSRLAPFWWTLLSVLAVLLVVELMLASRISWRRLGDPPASA